MISRFLGAVAALVLCAAMCCGPTARAADTLVIDMNMDDDLVSLAHAIDGFLFAPTMNFSPDLPGNLVRRFDAPVLKNHLSVTGLVTIDGKVAGFATEQEHVMTDPANGQPVAESSWLITLTLPGRSGVIAVAQRENAAGVFGLVQQVVKNSAGPWEDRFQSFLSTAGTYRVALATQDLAPYLGGRFEEYNLVNPADLARYKRIRGGIQFLIRPKE
ncbi:MAG: hypothetical protein U1F25_00195 [Rubrivivax sp.]